MKSTLEAGLGKIDKTAISSKTKVDQIESLVRNEVSIATI